MAALAGVKGGMTGLKGEVASGAAAWKSLGTSAVVAGGVAAMGLGLAVKAASQFEGQLKAVQIAGHYTEQQMDALKKSMLGWQIGATHEQMTAAMEGAVSAGYKAADAWKVAQEGIKATVVFGGDAERNTAALAKTMAIFGASAGQAGHYVDALARAVEGGSVHISDMAGFLPRAAQAANGAGVSMTDFMGILQASSHVSGQARQAVMALSQMFNKLHDSGYGAQIQQQGLLPVLEEVNAKYGDNDKALKKVLGSDTALNLFLLLRRDGFSSLATAIGKVTDSAGEMNKALAAHEATLPGQMDLLKKRASDLAVEVGDDVLPQIKELVGWLNKVTVSPAEVHEITMAAEALVAFGGAAAVAMGVNGLIGLGRNIVSAVGYLVGLTTATGTQTAATVVQGRAAVVTAGEIQALVVSLRELAAANAAAGGGAVLNTEAGAANAAFRAGFPKAAGAAGAGAAEAAGGGALAGAGLEIATTGAAGLTAALAPLAIAAAGVAVAWKSMNVVLGAPVFGSSAENARQAGEAVQMLGQRAGEALPELQALFANRPSPQTQNALNTLQATFDKLGTGAPADIAAASNAVAALSASAAANSPAVQEQIIALELKIKDLQTAIDAAKQKQINLAKDDSWGNYGRKVETASEATGKSVGRMMSLTALLGDSMARRGGPTDEAHNLQTALQNLSDSPTQAHLQAAQDALGKVAAKTPEEKQLVTDLHAEIDKIKDTVPVVEEANAAIAKSNQSVWSKGIDWLQRFIGWVKAVPKDVNITIHTHAEAVTGAGAAGVAGYGNPLSGGMGADGEAHAEPRGSSRISLLTPAQLQAGGLTKQDLGPEERDAIRGAYAADIPILQQIAALQKQIGEGQATEGQQKQLDFLNSRHDANVTAIKNAYEERAAREGIREQADREAEALLDMEGLSNAIAKASDQVLLNDNEIAIALEKQKAAAEAVATATKSAEEAAIKYEEDAGKAAVEGGLADAAAAKARAEATLALGRAGVARFPHPANRGTGGTPLSDIQPGTGIIAETPEQLAADAAAREKAIDDALKQARAIEDTVRPMGEIQKTQENINALLKDRPFLTNAADVAALDEAVKDLQAKLKRLTTEVPVEWQRMADKMGQDFTHALSGAIMTGKMDFKSFTKEIETQLLDALLQGTVGKGMSALPQMLSGIFGQHTAPVTSLAGGGGLGGIDAGLGNAFGEILGGLLKFDDPVADLAASRSGGDFMRHFMGGVEGGAMATAGRGGGGQRNLVQYNHIQTVTNASPAQIAGAVARKTKRSQW
jgi:TP901 family phage tail tape measure protein